MHGDCQEPQSLDKSDLFRNQFLNYADNPAWLCLKQGGHMILSLNLHKQAGETY